MGGVGLREAVAIGLLEGVMVIGFPEERRGIEGDNCVQKERRGREGDGGRGGEVALDSRDRIEWFLGKKKKTRVFV